MNRVNLEELSGGAFSEEFNRVLKQVTENIQDPNTKDTEKRKITCTFTFAPREGDRELVATSVTIKPTLSASAGIATAFVMGKDIETGEVAITEYGKQVKGQMAFKDVETETRRGYDPSTGEIYDVETEEEREHDNIVNLRAAR